MEIPILCTYCFVEPSAPSGVMISEPLVQRLLDQLEDYSTESTVHLVWHIPQKINVTIEECLGCGVCEDTCPNNAITMVKGREGKRDESEPGGINLFLSGSIWNWY